MRSAALCAKQHTATFTTGWQRVHPRCSGFEDAARRDAKLAEKYLQPLGRFHRIEFRAAAPRPASAAGGARPLLMTADMERVTPPLAGTSVYPNGAWQLRH